ncbi:hypothetical protein KUTeg_010865 [Tegillarca granosa]|uniref:Fibrinogen C-terminal domain-containing protein n=1 Tax=Tegillarca granosa TaxID=220873 RepID=A0ABQ9F280_TEGGR|nr:hypothetical protein KUTeg_010865 [Tegillarca granosa]
MKIKMLSFLWIVSLCCLLRSSESRICGSQMVNCVCSNVAFKKIKVQIALKHLLEKGTCSAGTPKDCEELYNNGLRENKVYTIYPDGKTGFDVYCDMKTDGGGWTVFQRRFNGNTDFYRTWNEYKHGFGKRSQEFWLGNDKIHLLTKLNSYQLRIDMEDFKGVRKYAKYSTFFVGSEANGYILNIGGYSGTAGDGLKYHNGSKFSTKDRDYDGGRGNCAHTYSGAWWYKHCHQSNLNGKYMKGSNSASSMNWHFFYNNYLSLRISEMKIKKIR